MYVVKLDLLDGHGEIEVAVSDALTYDRLARYFKESKKLFINEPPTTQEMVNRFLRWPVPPSVWPDGTPGKSGRTGTNLLSATEAKQMFEYVLNDAP